MRLIAFKKADGPALAVRRGDDIIDLAVTAPRLPRELAALLAQPGALAAVREAAPRARARALLGGRIAYLPTIMRPPKIICVGLNYIDHAAESPYKNAPTYPVLFNRFTSTLIGHKAPAMRPWLSEQFDYEGELTAVIGRRGRHIAKDRALGFVAGYTVFNDISVRDYQFKSTQWLMGKNFDSTGAIGPEFVSADELPPGARGLQLKTRLNGQIMQNANTTDMIFDVATLVATASAAMTLEPGDLIVSGTPAGVGFARKPPVFMKDGDVCDVEIEGIGTLSTPIKDEKRK
jgi:2-keto-4-pentenoate hydratase/2-oxohepta-3-ene-1,7-dioic acid hydratase in catechol pathway